MNAARVAALVLALSTLGTAAGAQIRLDNAIIGTWTSTLSDVDRDRTPPLKIAETVTLTISAGGSIYLERLSRAGNSRIPDRWVGSGVYSVPAPGVLRLSFDPNLQVSAVVWRYRLAGNTFTVIDNDTNVSRTFYRSTLPY